jgi:hypothetical protein
MQTGPVLEAVQQMLLLSVQTPPVQQPWPICPQVTVWQVPLTHCWLPVQVWQVWPLVPHALVVVPL